MGLTNFDLIQVNGIVGGNTVDSPWGTTYYLNNSTAILPGGRGGSNGNSGLSPLEPFSTITYALSKCVAGRGDRIVVANGHAETYTSSLTVPAGVRIIGCRLGNKLPTFTVNGTIDLFTLSGAGASIENIQMDITTTDAATALVNVSAAGCALSGVRMIPSATSVNVVDCVTIASGADDFSIDRLQIFNTTVPVNSFISIEAAVARFALSNSYMSGDVATAGIIDGATATQLLFDNVVVRTIGTNIPAVILDSNPTGTVRNFHALGTDATIANNAQWGSALILSDIRVRGGTGSTVQATNIQPGFDT